MNAYKPTHTQSHTLAHSVRHAGSVTFSLVPVSTKVFINNLLGVFEARVTKWVKGKSPGVVLPQHVKREIKLTAEV